MARIKEFFLSKRGINTVEVVVILAVVLGIALIFRKEIMSFATDLFEKVFNPSIQDDLDPLKMAN